MGALFGKSRKISTGVFKWIFLIFGEFVIVIRNSILVPIVFVKWNKSNDEQWNQSNDNQWNKSNKVSNKNEHLHRFKNSL